MARIVGYMRPTPAMKKTCAQALQWYSDYPEARALSSGWMRRFARSVGDDKRAATVERVAEWFDDHAGFKGSPGFFTVSGVPTAERVAFDMLGGDAGAQWAAAAVADASEATTGDVVELADRPTLRRPATFADERRPEWEGVLCLEGVLTSDNRLISEGGLSWRELPITLQDQLLSQGGHDGAVAVGPITHIFREPSAEGGNLIRGEGTFDSNDDGMAARERLHSGSKSGVSVDLTEVELDLPDDPGELEEILFGDGVLRITAAKIGAATLVSIPAFEGARLQIAGDIPETVDREALVASGGRLEGVTFTVTTVLEMTVVDAELGVTEGGVDFDEVDTPGPCDQYHECGQTGGVCENCGNPADDHQLSGFEYSEEHLEALVASGRGPRPHSTWFAQRAYDEPTPVTVDEPDEDGLVRFHGHLGLAGSCHISFDDRCVDVPMGLDYTSFQGDRSAGQVRCSDGVEVKAGPVVMGTEHAPIRDAAGRSVSAGAATDHYAHTGCIVGQVRCYEDAFGVQMQGWLLPGLTDGQLAVLDAVDVSPDWRGRATASGGRGVVALLAVPVSGFNTALAASGGPEEPVDEAVPTPDVEAAVATRKIELLARLDLPVPVGLGAEAGLVEAPELSARKASVMSRLGVACECGGDCCTD